MHYQAALNRFGTAVTYMQKNSISGKQAAPTDAQYLHKLTMHIDVFNAVPLEAEYGLVPKENSIFGPVNESYDLLRDEDVATSHFIREEFVFEIKHCLLARRGVKIENVTRVISHEQVGTFASTSRSDCADTVRHNRRWDSVAISLAEL